MHSSGEMPIESSDVRGHHSRYVNKNINDISKRQELRIKQ